MKTVSLRFALLVFLGVSFGFASGSKVLNATSSSSSCKTVDAIDLNVTEYTRATWYSQMQQITKYLPTNTFYCVAATYETDTTKKVPFFSGKVIAVNNYANVDKVNGKNQNDDGTVLCARVPDSNKPGKLEVAPCFLPNILSGDYWVVAAGPSSSNYEWAIISGGQPTVQYDDGCTTKETGTNGSGFWFFTREKIASQDTLDAMKAKAKSLGFTLSRLHSVTQEGCTYHGAIIKN